MLCDSGCWHENDVSCTNCHNIASSSLQCIVLGLILWHMMNVLTVYEHHMLTRTHLAAICMWHKLPWYQTLWQRSWELLIMIMLTLHCDVTEYQLVWRLWKHMTLYQVWRVYDLATSSCKESSALVFTITCLFWKTEETAGWHVVS